MSDTGLRYLFLGSPPFANPVLERLLASRHAAVALVTPPDRPRGRGRQVEPSSLVRLARAHQLRVLQPEEAHASEVQGELRALEPDVLMVCSYGVILKPELLELAPHGALNVHASLLPRHRGASPIQAAILCGDEVTGVSIQRMVAALDEGDVLTTREHAIGAHTTAPELALELARLGGEAAVEALDRIEAGTAVFTPQDSSRATYARKLRKEHGRIDFARPAREIERRVRAFASWPGARCLDPKGRVLTLLRARVVGAAPGEHAPGELIETDGRLVVATGSAASDDALEFLELVPAGKRPMSAAEYQRGARFQRGDRLTSEPAIQSFVVPEP